MPSVWGVIDKKDDPFGTSSRSFELELKLTPSSVDLSSRTLLSSRLLSADLFPSPLSASLLSLLCSSISYSSPGDRMLCRYVGRTQRTSLVPDSNSTHLPPTSPHSLLLSPHQTPIPTPTHIIPCSCPLQLYPPPLFLKNPINLQHRSLATLLFSSLLNGRSPYSLPPPYLVALAQGTPLR